MVALPLGKSDWRRFVADEPFIQLKNRYFEENPANPEEQTALLARPSLKRWKAIGEGPIRGIYSQPGSFDDCLFAISGNALYRLNTDNTEPLIGSGFFANSARAFASMAATATLGTGTPEMLYIADGQTLWLYMQNGFALGTLTATGAILNGDSIRVGDMYYQWTSGSVNAGTPLGTLANPWLVALGTSNTNALDNARAAINAAGGPGVQYTSILSVNTKAKARASTATLLTLQAIEVGTTGNGVETTDVGANIAWGGITLSGGGSPYITTVILPDDLFAVAVAFIAGYIIVIPAANTVGFNGRFFWIEPGETFVRNLNFATAERSPDPLLGVRVVGDQFWLFGTNTTEVWYPSGDLKAPFTRAQGQLFDRGIVSGTDVQVKDAVFITDTDGVVYKLGGGQPQRISNNSIEERIRRGIVNSIVF